MSIVAIIASPRKKGNTCTIVEAISAGARENGKDVKVYHLNSLSNVKGCQACMACKGKIGCATNDDQSEILTAIRDAEGVIFSTPNYFGEANGQFRLLQDRFYSFMGADMAPNITPGKKLAVVVSCAGPPEGGRALADKIEKSMAGYFKFEPIGKIVLGGAGAPNTASGNSSVLEDAKCIGKKF